MGIGHVRNKPARRKIREQEERRIANQEFSFSFQLDPDQPLATGSVFAGTSRKVQRAFERANQMRAPEELGFEFAGSATETTKAAA